MLILTKREVRAKIRKAREDIRNVRIDKPDTENALSILEMIINGDIKVVEK